VTTIVVEVVHQAKAARMAKRAKLLPIMEAARPRMAARPKMAKRARLLPIMEAARPRMAARQKMAKRARLLPMMEAARPRMAKKARLLKLTRSANSLVAKDVVTIRQRFVALQLTVAQILRRPRNSPSPRRQQKLLPILLPRLQQTIQLLLLPYPVQLHARMCQEVNLSRLSTTSRTILTPLWRTTRLQIVKFLLI